MFQHGDERVSSAFVADAADGQSRALAYRRAPMFEQTGQFIAVKIALVFKLDDARVNVRRYGRARSFRPSAGRRANGKNNKGKADEFQAAGFHQQSFSSGIGKSVRSPAFRRKRRMQTHSVTPNPSA